MFSLLLIPSHISLPTTSCFILFESLIYAFSKMGTTMFDGWVNGQLADSDITSQLNTLIRPHTTAASFPKFDNNTKKLFSTFCIQKYETANVELKLSILRTLRVLFRDKDGLEALVVADFPAFIVKAAALMEASENVNDFEVVMEACRCLVNGLYQSETVRNGFIADNCLYVGHLADRIFTTSLQIFNPSVQQPIFTDYTPERLLELLYLDLRIAFVITALSKEAKAQLSDHVLIFVGVVCKFVDRLTKNPTADQTYSVNCATESLKVLFNVFCHSLDYAHPAAKACAAQCAQIVRSDIIPAELKQDAVNVLSTLSSTPNELCPTVDGDDNNPDSMIFDEHDVSFVDALLKLLDQQMDTIPADRLELLGTFFTVLFHLCRDLKAVRRYCRMRVFPPLRAADVERPPEEGNTLRNRMIRLMNRSQGECRRLIAEFFFLLCKRSVPRMIKYCGFGHSAGFLADYGFLGRINELRRASDSEDSETEDYKRVESDVNAVTGFIQPPRLVNPFEGMSEEQKEHEAMKLANTMDKILEAGVFVPGRIGADGRPIPVSHVAELVKDVEVKTDESDSE